MRRESLKDHGQEQRTFNLRVVVAVLGAMVLTGIVITRLVVLQIVHHQHFQELSTGNRIRIEPLPPTRGLIFDRNGVLLAENLPAYQLELIPEQVDDIDDTLSRLTALGLLRVADEERFRKALARHPRRFKPIPLRYRLSEEELARFSVKRQHFDGVDIRPRLARHYPLGATAVHVIGYVGSLSSDDLNSRDSASYAGTTHIGKTGIERAYETDLHGEVGYQQVLINAKGRALKVVDQVQPKPGLDLYLTLDVRLQSAAEAALGDRRGAVVAVDPRSGDVIALASTPGFDPNPFGEGLTQKEYSALANSRDKPLFNRALAGQYPPGSTVKPVLGLASLQYGTANPWEKMFCPGHFSLPGNDHRYRDWKPRGHGSVNLAQSIEQSCDVYFYQLALDLGIDRIHAFSSQFSFGQRTGIDINGERPGLLPSRDWKRTRFRRKADQVWFPGETVITGIGQGFWLSTPLQLAHATAIVASRGQRHPPQLLDAVRNPLNGDINARERRILPPIEVDDPIYWQHISDAMRDVVYGTQGTARAVGQGSGYTVAGKTGTAQVFTVGQEEDYDDLDVSEELRHHGWFVAYAPLDEPQIALAVLIENGGGGSTSAAPVARQVLDAYFQANRPTLAQEATGD
ncbi:MAG: penicillin-binding protein 2 [Gammaproteobacteria bacterium]